MHLPGSIKQRLSPKSGIIRRQYEIKFIILNFLFCLNNFIEKFLFILFNIFKLYINRIIVGKKHQFLLV